jgi:hypothetical protein
VVVGDEIKGMLLSDSKLKKEVVSSPEQIYIVNVKLK